MDVDDVFVKTGEFGKFQKRAFFAMCITTLFCGTQMVQNIFDGSVPDESDLVCESNGSLKACDAKCSETASRDTFISYANEWRLFCGTLKSYVDLTQSIYMLGVMVGSFFMGGLGDRFGRWPILFGCECLTSLFAFASAFAQSWIALTCLRFLTGFFLSGIIIVGFVLSSELVGPSKRNLIGTIPALTFAVGICFMSVVAWMTQNWRTMAGICGLFGVITIFPVWWLYEESPRWHLGKGNVQKSQEILSKIARINGHDLGTMNLKRATPSANGNKSGGTSMLDLFRNRILLKITLVQMYTWFTVSAVYYGLTLAAGDMGGNRYVSVVLNAFVEIPSNLLVIYLMNHPRCGRVKTCVLSLVVGAVCCFSVWLLPSTDSFTSYVVALACGGKFFVCMAFAIVYVQAAELYPTPVRNVGLGFISIFNRIGGVLSPQFVRLDSYWHNSHFILFGALATICAVVCLMLPETLGRPLPDSPEELYMNVKKLDKDVVRLKSSVDRQKLLSDMDDEEEVDTSNV